MNFASQITRSPRVFEPDRGIEIADRFSGIAPDVKEVLVGTGGSSPFLYGLMTRHADWLIEALDMPPGEVLPRILGTVGGGAPKQTGSALRLAKARVALYVALADLAGVWTLEQVTGALTDFADFAVGAGLRSLLLAEIGRGKLPGVTEDDARSGAGMCFLAMGKMGAGELNYSSDIDLISLFDESRFEPDDYGEVRAVFIRVTRNLAAMLSEPTSEGYVFRTDLRLRPDPSVTPVCLSMEAAERYYESVGRTWERAAYVKARPAAGDLSAGDAFLERLRPFIWRKHLDFAAIQDAHDMRLRIRDHKKLHGAIQLEGHNMKLGAGGIREIEFFTQTRQIIAGGRDPGLRQRETVQALAALAENGWVPKDAATQLAEDYRAHREVEHRIQMVADAQTHDLPNTPEGIARIAALCGRDVEEFRADVLARLRRVDEITEGFFAPSQPEATVKSLEGEARETLERWRTYPALRSARSVEIFQRIAPEILSRLDQAAEPQEALRHFDRFLSGLPAGVQVFALFEANPHLIDLMVDIAATAPHLAAYLGHNAGVFDAVIGGGFFAEWPGPEKLSASLRAMLDETDDYEAALDTARRWQKEWHFRVGVHQLRGLISADEAGAQYAALADAVLAGLWPVVGREFARKHGPQPGRGAVVLGMGSLGSSRLTAASDLDLIVIYDAAGVEESDGPRPLQTRVYFARLTQALVTALSAPMSEGRLYEVDMRLRPSGRQGPVATSLQSFRSYQTDEAWTWEHMALTRARPVVGDPALASDIEAFRSELLGQERDPVKILTDVAEMRARIAAAKPPKGDLEAKLGPGRMQDVELLAQAAALIAGVSKRGILMQLNSAEKLGWITAGQHEALDRSYRLMWQLQSAARLLTGEVLDFASIGQGGTAFLLREVGCATPEDLSEQLVTVADAAAAAIDQVLGPYSSENGSE